MRRGGLPKTEKNLGEETQIIPLLARLGLRRFLSLIGLSFTLKIGGGAALALLFSMSLGWLLFVGAIALIFGFDLTRLIGIKYQMVILFVIWAYVGIKKKPV